MSEDTATRPPVAVVQPRMRLPRVAKPVLRLRMRLRRAQIHADPRKSTHPGAALPDFKKF